MVSELLIAGPTASGKSAVALELAGRLNAEIISVDSMQVYRGLDIGTAKPSPAERTAVPHHLIDVVEIAQPFDAAQFAAMAKRVVADIRSRGRIPVLCGGTGLYFKAYLEGIGGGPPSDPAVRNELEQTPLPDLLRELEQRDPVLFQQIDRQNPRRVIRALEVIRLTGCRYSELRTPWKRGSRDVVEENRTFRFFGLRRESTDLHRRIDARVDQMLQQGLIDETRQLLAAGLAGNKTAMQAIGYRQAVEYLQGIRTLEETIALVKIKTRQYAKRQMTWFRNQASVEWIDVAADETVGSIAGKIEARATKKPVGPTDHTNLTRKMERGSR